LSLKRIGLDYQISYYTQQKPTQQTLWASEIIITTFILSTVKCYLYESSWGNLTAKESIRVMHMAH